MGGGAIYVGSYQQSEIRAKTEKIRSEIQLEIRTLEGFARAMVPFIRGNYNETSFDSKTRQKHQILMGVIHQLRQLDAKLQAAEGNLKKPASIPYTVLSIADSLIGYKNLTKLGYGVVFDFYTSQITDASGTHEVSPFWKTSSKFRTKFIEGALYYYTSCIHDSGLTGSSSKLMQKEIENYKTDLSTLISWLERVKLAFQNGSPAISLLASAMDAKHKFERTSDEIFTRVAKRQAWAELPLYFKLTYYVQAVGDLAATVASFTPAAPYSMLWFSVRGGGEISIDYAEHGSLTLRSLQGAMLPLMVMPGSGLGIKTLRGFAGTCVLTSGVISTSKVVIDATRFGWTADDWRLVAEYTILTLAGFLVPMGLARNVRSEMPSWKNIQYYEIKVNEPRAGTARKPSKPAPYPRARVTTSSPNLTTEPAGSASYKPFYKITLSDMKAIVKLYLKGRWQQTGLSNILLNLLTPENLAAGTRLQKILEAQLFKIYQYIGLDKSKIKEFAYHLTVLIHISEGCGYVKHGHNIRTFQYLSMLVDELVRTGKLGKIDGDLALFSALLHDLGKSGISSETLNSNLPAPVAIKQIGPHAQVGYSVFLELCRRMGIKNANKISGGIQDHHEIPDGSGYPRRLQGDQISLPGKLVKLADTFDAMTCRTGRGYRQPLTYDQAITTFESLIRAGKIDGHLGRLFIYVLQHDKQRALSIIQNS